MIFPNFGFQKHQPLTPLFHQLNRNAAIHQLRSLPKPQRQCLDVFVHPCRAARAVRPASRDLDPQDPCRAGRTGPPSRRPRRSSSRRRTCPSLEEKLGEVSIRDPGVPNVRRSTLASPKSEKHPQPPSKQLEGRRLPSKDVFFFSQVSWSPCHQSHCARSSAPPPGCTRGAEIFHQLHEGRSLQAVPSMDPGAKVGVTTTTSDGMMVLSMTATKYDESHENRDSIWPKWGDSLEYYTLGGDF